ncbi:DUF6961 family protein [Sphingopyxis panaciterrae]
MSSYRDDQIWASALAAEHDHGDEAESYARLQASLATTAGDASEAAVWNEVATLLHKLHSIGQPLKTIGPSDIQQL